MIRRLGVLVFAGAIFFANGCSKANHLTAPTSGARGTAPARDREQPGRFNQRGNLLIADQFNNRVIEVDPTGRIIWSFGLGPTDFSDKSIIGVNDAQRVGQLTLMAGTGTPPGVIPQSPGGAVDNRVILVDSEGRIVWQYGQFGLTGSGRNLLSAPVQCTFLPNSHILITDQGNGRIIEVSMRKRIVWEYPGPNTTPADQLNSPNSAELLQNGNILIADENNNRAIEVNRAHHIVKTFTALIGATIARGHDSLEAAALAAHLHGRAGSVLRTYAPASDLVRAVAAILDGVAAL